MIDLDVIREGLDRGEFFLEYLPTIRLADDKCVGAEALTRWRRPEGIVPPSEFIPQIERTPVAGLLTYWVIETMAAELGDWLRRTAGVHMAINVPPELFGRGGMEFAAKKAGLIGVADKLVLEVTERGIPDEIGVETIVSRTGDRRLLRLALDDVGLAGHGLAVLSHIGADIVKLDKSVIGQIADGSSVPVIEAVATMARAAGFEVIAEGVEQKEQADFLRRAGIHMAQGWHFSKPLPAGRFLEFCH